jgi:Disaggregatase related
MDGLYVITSSDVEAWNNKITCRTNSGLRIYNTNHVRFHNNVISSEGEGGAGIEVQKFNGSNAMDDIEICNNLLNMTNVCGIWITGYGTQCKKYSAKDVYIHHNKFYKTGTNQNFDWGGGIVLNGFQSTLIENNFFDGCYGSAIAHKEVTDEFSAPGSGYTTVVKNNIIVNTQPSRKAGKGSAIFNELNSTHSFILINNFLSNNTGGNYLYAGSTSDIKVYSGFAEQVSKNDSLKKDFPWNEALSSGPQKPYQIEGLTRLNHVSANLIKILPLV